MSQYTLTLMLPERLTLAALLLALRRRQIAHGMVLRVDGWPRRLNNLAALYGVRDLLAA